jgi:hypothetical protein
MSVTESVQKGEGHRSDQGRVWAEVAQHLRAHGVASESSAMEDTFKSHRGRVDELQKGFAYVEEACGVAVALGKSVVCLDLFDKPSTCGKVWDRLLSGALREAFCPSTDENQTDVGDVENFIADLGTEPWQAIPVGEGREFRSATEHGSQASALCFDEHIVHGSAVAAGQN